MQIFCRTVEFFEPQERRLSLSATQSGGGGSTAGGQGKKDASTKEGPDSSGKDKNEDENKKVIFIDIFILGTYRVRHKELVTHI